MLPLRVPGGRRLWQAALRNGTLFAALAVFVLVGGLFSRSSLVTAQSLPQNQDPSFFPATGYRINSPAILSYFQHRGGVRTLGYPVSNDFPLQGRPVPLFQRQMLAGHAEGSVPPANILSTYLRPVNPT